MKELITILGPTASGKTSVAAALAKETGGEIISADSRQVYRGMDIGTGKDLEEYGSVPYHLINICVAGEKYNLFRYQKDFRKALDDIRNRDVYPILCGGTGLYIESVLRGYKLPCVPQNPGLRSALEGKPLAELTAILAELKQRNGTKLHNQTDTDSAQRAIRAIEIETGTTFSGDGNKSLPRYEQREDLTRLVFGIDISREMRREKITQRLRKRLDNGMIEEIRGLLNGGIKAEDLIYYGLEYKYVTEYCIGLRSYDDMFHNLEIAIHQFAKRQMTWFRGMERRGIAIHWIDANLPMEAKIREITALL